MNHSLKLIAATACIVCAGAAMAQKGETVRIAMIEGLSGPFGNVGQNQLKSWQFIAENLNGANNAAVELL